MPQYAYTVKTQEGVPTSGVLDAPDRETAVRTLVGQNLIVTCLSEVVSGRRAWGSRVSTEQLLSFTQSVSAMLEAGMTLGRALRPQLTAIRERVARVSRRSRRGRGTPDARRCARPCAADRQRPAGHRGSDAHRGSDRGRRRE